VSTAASAHAQVPFDRSSLTGRQLAEEEDKDREAMAAQHEVLVSGRVVQHLAHQCENVHEQLVASARRGQPRQQREEQLDAAEAVGRVAHRVRDTRVRAHAECGRIRFGGLGSACA
jgi:hypothetical protein